MLVSAPSPALVPIEILKHSVASSTVACVLLVVNGKSVAQNISQLTLLFQKFQFPLAGLQYTPELCFYVESSPLLKEKIQRPISLGAKKAAKISGLIFNRVW